jgi:hypothetical protein
MKITNLKNVLPCLLMLDDKNIINKELEKLS